MTSIAALPQEIHATTPSPRQKPSPPSRKAPLAFAYTGSTDGTDENLLILFHGFGMCDGDPRRVSDHLISLGDTHVPFTKLGRSLNLPQTATLAIRGPTP